MNEYTTPEAIRTLTRDEWRKHYSAYRLYWKQNTAWIKAHTAHKKRTVTRKQMDATGASIPGGPGGPLWRVLSHVNHRADRYHDGQRYYFYRTMAYDNRLWAGNTVPYASIDSQMTWHPVIGSGAFKTWRNNMRELREKGLAS